MGNRFDGIVVYVTGAGDGIGRATALRFAAEGATVGILTLDAGQADSVAAGCRNLGAAAAVAVGDLARPEVVAAGHENLVREIGAADVLVNNVGIEIDRPFLELTDEDYERTFRVNVLAGVRMTRLVLPTMLANGKGVLIHMSSAQGIFGWPQANSYAVSKGAIISFSRQIANEFGTRGIRSNTVIPGAVMTAMQRERIDREGPVSERRSANLHIIPRLEEPDEVAAAVAFLASDDARFVTGTELRVDGGTLSKAHSYVDPA